MVSVVCLLCLDGYEGVAVFQRAAAVEPVDSLGGGAVEAAEALPGPRVLDRLGLVERDHRLGQRCHRSSRQPRSWA